MKKQVAVVIPYYHNELSETERIAFKQCIKVLLNYPIMLIAPDSIEISEAVQDSGVQIVKVPSKWMQSIESYNQMMLNENFYRMFLEYKYILIYQLDAFVFQDELKKFCNLGYDYIGAPWLFGAEYFKGKRDCRGNVGNGGFSLRNVEASIKMLKDDPVSEKSMPEDVYWSIHDSDEFSVAPKEVALQFSIEEPAEKMFWLNGQQLPFGCHAWNKKSFVFWKPIIENFGYELSEARDANNQKLFKNHFQSVWSLSCDEFKAGIRKLGLGKEKVFIWGAGVIGKGWVIAFQCAGVAVQCVDSDEARWGEYLWNVRIESPDVLKYIKEGSTLFIATKKYKDEVKERLLFMGILHKLRIFFYEDVLKNCFIL